MSSQGKVPVFNKHMVTQSKNEIVARSSCWVASVLNLLPGLGAGYLYQRRWGAYWTTCAVTFLWLISTTLSEQSLDSLDPLSIRSSANGFWGIALIASFTSIEASFAVQRARQANSDVKFKE